jgi:beta-lactamase regulating signal transducer with metallopeptidase domain
MSLIHSSEAILAGTGNEARAAFAAFSHLAAPAAVAAVWQSLLVAFALVLCLRFLLRVSAAHRFAAWAAGFAVAALSPLLPLVEHFAINHSVAIATSAPATTGSASWFQLDSHWGFVIAALWLAGSTFRAVELIFHSLRLRRLWRSATPVEVDASIRTLLAGAFPARRTEICIAPNLDRPSVIGFFAPRILIPDWLYPRLTSGELEQVVLHEAEHLRRRDDWTNLLQKIALVVFPLNPALAWMERRLCREREMACDEGVVHRTQAPRTYAACLASLAERRIERREFLRRAQSLSLGVFGRRPELIHRVDSILRRRQPLHPLAAGTLVGVLSCGLIFAAIELSRGPQLVAFVAAPTPDSKAALVPPPTGTPELARISVDPTRPIQPATGDAIFHPSQHVRAIETRAILPANSNAASSPVASRPTHDGNQSARAPESARSAPSAAPRSLPVRFVPPPSEISSPAQEFVVLTAWEEVQTSSPRTRTVADYDTSAATPEQSGVTAEQNGASAHTQFTFTRLILFVVPANSATGSPSSAAPSSPAATAAGANTSNQTGSKPASNSVTLHPHRPAPSAFDGGWLFFQL